MYIVSCRKDFDSNQFPGDNQYRNHTNPNDSSAFAELTLEQLQEQVRNKHVGILVHGFNNTMDQVMNAYWEMVTRMKDNGTTGLNGYGLVIGFTWPGFQTGVGYFTAMLAAKRAGPKLATLINDIRGVAHTVDVQTHSLGARVALTALKDPKTIFVDNLLLSAPAVDNHLVEPDEEFNSSLSSCSRCFVYHSKNDKVLKVGFLVGDIADGFHKALGLNGPRSKPVTLSKCPNLHVIDCSARVKGHGDYRKTNKYFDHWKEVLSGTAMSRYDELS